MNFSFSTELVGSFSVKEAMREVAAEERELGFKEQCWVKHEDR